MSENLTVRLSDLTGQTAVFIGGSGGIGLESARLARAAGADVILTGRNEERLEQAATALGARRSEAFDATDRAALQLFFESLTDPVDHVMLTAGGPSYAPLADIDDEMIRSALDESLRVPLDIARYSVGRVRPGGSLIFMSGTGARQPNIGMTLIGMATAAIPTLAANLALELAPIRVNVIAPGFVDTPLSASLLGDDLEKRREQLRTTLPIARVVGPADVAALALHLMTNTALTGATYDIDGGQQLVAGS